MTLVVPLLLPAYSVLCLFTVAVAFKRNIRSTELGAKVHGRGDILLLLSKVVLTLVFTLLWNSIDPWLAHLLVLGSALIYTGNYLVYQPHIVFEVNSAKSGLAAAYLFTTITSLVILMDPSISFSIILIFGIPLAALVGYMGSQLRQTVISRMSLDDLRRYHEFSVWARKHAQLYEKAKSSQRQASFDISLDEPIATGNECLLESKQASEMDRRLDAVKEQVELAYRTCMDKFASNGNALLEASSFFRNYRDNLFMEMMTLNLAKRSAKAVDVQFVVFERLRELREEEQKANEMEMRAVDRVLFDQHFTKACDLETKCYRIIYQFWATVNRRIPDIAQLQVLAEELTQTSEEVEMHYDDCLKLNSESVVALRSFGTFLSKVKSEQERSAEFLAKADRIEDHMGKQKKRQIGKFSFFQNLKGIERTDESAGVIIISGDRVGMGQILEANTEACRMFGRPKDELVGHNITVIIPKPFSLVHDIYLRRFSRTGSSTFVNTNRALLGLDSSGALIPLIMNVSETPPQANDQNASPRLSASIRCPKTEDHFLLFDGQSNGYKILHADTMTLSRVMGMTARQLEAKDISAADYLSDLKAFGGDIESVCSADTSRSYNDNQAGMQIESVRQSGKNLTAAANKPNNMSLADEGFGLGGELFLQSLEQTGDYSKISFDNVADEEVQNVEARVQTISVTDYGTVFLFAWKIPTSSKRRRKKRAEKAEPSTLPPGHENEKARHGSFIVSSSSCPYATSEKNRSAPHPFESMDGAGTETKGHFPLSSLVPTRSISSNGELPEVKRTDSQSENEGLDLTEGSPLQGVQRASSDGQPSLNPDGSPFQNDETFGSFTDGKRDGARKPRGGRASSVGTTTASVTKMVQSVVGSTSTGMKPVILKLQCILISMMVAFVLLTIAVPAVIDSRYTAFDEHALSSDVGASEMMRFGQTENILAKVHIAGTDFNEAVDPEKLLWASFEKAFRTYYARMESSRNSAVSVGGKARAMELATHFDVEDKQNADSERLSVDEFRDYMHSHLQALVTGENVSKVLFGNTLRTSVLIFDNAQKYSLAVNDSTRARIIFLREATVDLQEQITIILASICAFGLIVVLGVVVHLLYLVYKTRNAILTTFLYIPQNSAKWITGIAAQALKQHIEKVTKSDLGESNDFDDSLSLNSGTQVDGDDRYDSDQAPVGQLSKSKDSQRKGLVEHDINKLRKTAASGTVGEMRKHVNTSKFMVKSVNRVALPLIPVIIWVMFFIVDATLIMKGIREEVGRGYEINQALVELIEYQRNLRSLAFRVTRPAISFGTASIETREVYVDKLQELSRSVLNRIDKIQHGGESVDDSEFGGYMNSRIEQRVFAEDACIILEEDSAALCKKTPLSAGFRNFFREFFNDGAHIVSELPPISMSNEKALEQIANDISLQERIRRLDGVGLAVEIGERLAVLAIESTSDDMDESVAHQLVTTITCSLSFIFAILFVSLPAVATAGRSLMASFQALQLVPDEVLSANRQLRKKIRTLATTVSSSKVGNEANSVLLAAEVQKTPKRRSSA